MIIIMPYKISPQNTQRQKSNADKGPLPNFLGSNAMNQGQYVIPPNLLTVKLKEPFLAPTWIKDSTILKSMKHLYELEFSKEDIMHVQEQGAILTFSSGKDAVDFIKTSKTQIKFSPMAAKNEHAQYDYENKTVNINENYKNTQDPAEVLAIAEAILHEAGHAKDNNGQNCIQEEINCLALNAISHKAFSKKFPDIFLNSESIIIKEGVSLYAELFFDNDLNKTKLINRLREKYGDLPTGDLEHPPSDLALTSKKVYH